MRKIIDLTLIDGIDPTTYDGTGMISSFRTHQVEFSEEDLESIIEELLEKYPKTNRDILLNYMKDDI